VGSRIPGRFPENFDGDRRKLKGYVTNILADEALRSIHENAGRPFLLYPGHKAGHADFFPAERHKHLYSDVQIPHPKSIATTEENYRVRPE
jgi:N-acetylglucosamine-6-sulfatase